MKTLFKITIAVIFTISTTVSFAQTFGLKAGLNLSKMQIQDNQNNDRDDLSIKPGYHFGATVDIPIGKVLSFETGLFLASKGVKSSFSQTNNSDSYTLDTKINMHYLDIPLTAKATFSVAKIKIYGLIGPNIGIGLKGKVKYDYTENGQSDSETYDIEWGNDENNDDFKRLDIGLLIGAGVEINNFVVGASYNLGLVNLSPNTSAGYTVRNRVIGISLGYRFGKQ